ncbi:hypothetical protein WH47_04295, partial [Habropoda laboriosa]
ILAVLVIGLIVDPLNSYQKILIRTHFKLDDAAIIYVTVAGYLIINSLFVICHFMGDQIPKRTLVVLLIFVLVVYTILLADSNLSSVICILILVLSGAYTFVLAIDSICQFCGEELHSIPMFIFSFLGTIFFGLVGIFLILVHNVTIPWYVLTIACLSLLSCVLFVIRVSIILAFWKRQCNLCKQCCYSKQAEALLQRNICHPLCTETVKYDLTTSVSSVRVPSGDEGAIPDHSYRKVAYGHRRQYVDCPTSARQLAFVDVANVQTEHRAMCNIQSQTKQDVKESPVQTVSRCELCNRQMQFFSSTSAMVPTDQQTPCAPCPALVQLLRGTPCCPGCRCVTGIIQVPQQSQQQQTQRHEKSKQDKEADKEQTHAADEKSYEMLTSGEYSPQDQQLKGVSGTITKLTLASYCVTPKTTDISCQTTTETTKKTGEPVEPKKVRVSFSNKGKQDAKKKSDMLIPEKETSKATNNTAKKALRPAKKTPESSTEKLVESFAEKQKYSAEKQVESSAKKQESSPEKEESAEKEISEIPTEKAVKSPVEQPVEPATQKAPESTAEDAEKDSDKSSDPAMVISEQKKLIPPPRQVAEIIDRLQEMEGTKGESLMMPQSADILDSTVSQRETKSVVIGEGKAVTISQPSTTGNGKETEKEDEPRTDEKRRASTLDTKTNHPDSEEVSLISEESSKLSVNQKEKMKGENDKPKSDDSTAKEERAQETDSTTKPHMGTQT